MFTGIIEHRGAIAATEPAPGGRRLRIDVGGMAAELAPGASVAVSGVCLTVAAVAGAAAEFDVIRETLARTTLGDKRRGDGVNLERSLRVGDRLDGHFVQGHVDGVSTVQRVISSPREWVVWLDTPDDLAGCIVPKGSVALDGVSLTIAEVGSGGFSVALIPTTLARTTLARLAAGDRVNIETDVLVRAVVHNLSRGGQGLTLSALREAGFA
ncbi:MAG: riboflavin synthase [Planctomycetes bacterium]|nr:riboflavin synthase [Planctomycetota bacterium]